MPIDPLPLIVGLATLFFAGLVQGLTGFGFALVSVPILSLFISPKTVAPIMILYTVGTNLIILYHARHAIQPKRIWVLALAGIIGVPVGARLLVVMSPDDLRLFIGVTVVIAAVVMAMGIRFHVKRERLASGPVGFVSGILSGSIAVGGPPVILFFANQGIPRETFRANITLYFLAISVVANVTFFSSGLITSEAVSYAGWFSPGLLLGVLVGNRFTHRLPERVFRVVALLIVTVGGILSVLNGLHLI